MADSDKHTSLLHHNVERLNPFLLANSRLEWKWLTVTNPLTYYTVMLLIVGFTLRLISNGILPSLDKTRRIWQWQTHYLISQLQGLKVLSLWRSTIGVTFSLLSLLANIRLGWKCRKCLRVPNPQSSHCCSVNYSCKKGWSLVAKLSLGRKLQL